MTPVSNQRVRGVVSKAFTPRVIKRLYTTITAVIDELVEPISRPRHEPGAREIAEALKIVTRRIANRRKNGPAPWKPIV